MRRTRGITILELLIVVVVLGVIITLLARLFVATRVSYELSERVAEERQNVESAAQILKYDLGLGGYRGVDANAESRTFTCTFEFTDGATVADPDQIKVWYYEDRFVTVSPTLKTVEFSLTGTNLMRDEGGTATEVVSNVSDFQFIAWHKKNLGPAVTGDYITYSTPNSTNADELVGYQLQLTFVGGEVEIVSVALPNPQEIAATC